MNFTREPIIETVITPREGCKLVVRNSKGAAQEDYFVDAVEVVSFGHSFFFRSLERPKSFLVPVSDYEILELKETRMVLKNASPDRSIKIGGGRDQQVRPQKEVEELEGQPSQNKMDRKRDKRRRGRRGRDRQEMPAPAAQPAMQEYEEESFSEEGESIEERVPVEVPSFSEEVKAPSFISKLFPPPPTLIKETLSRYKPAEGGEDTFLEPSFEEEPKEAIDESLFDHKDEIFPEESREDEPEEE